MIQFSLGGVDLGKFCLRFIQNPCFATLASEFRGNRERTVKLHSAAFTPKLGVRCVAEIPRLVLAAGIFRASASTFPKGQ
jgi:hypothetical protein